MEILQQLAENYKLDVINTTSERNGYPSNTQYGLIGFETFSEAEVLAKKYDLEIVVFEKRDGWNFWYRSGNAYQSFINSSEDYGDNYSEFSKMDEEDFIENEVKFFFEDQPESFEKIESFLKAKKEIWEEIENMAENEIVITHEGIYSETIKKESMYFYHDTYHYAIGLQEK